MAPSQGASSSPCEIPEPPCARFGRLMAALTLDLVSKIVKRDKALDSQRKVTKSPFPFPSDLQRLSTSEDEKTKKELIG